MEKQPMVSSEQERQLGQQIVSEMMGEGFLLHFDTYPHNKGIKGDEGVIGETVEIESPYAFPGSIKYMVENSELIARVSSRISNEIAAVTKVLFMTVGLEPSDTTQ